MDPMRPRKLSRACPRLWLACSALATIVLFLLLGIHSGISGAQSALIRAAAQDDTRVEDDPDIAYRYVTVGWLDWAAVHFGENARSQDDAEGWILAGLALHALGDRAGALDAYERGARLASDPRVVGAAWTLIGNLRLEQEDWDGAQEAFEHALELVPQNAQARYGVGRIYEHGGRRDQAIKWYQSAVETAGDWIEPAVAQAALLNQVRRFIDALSVLKEVEGLGTWHAEYHYQLALSYEGLMRMTLEEGIGEELSAALADFRIHEERATEILKEQALHAAERAQELYEGHRGAQELVLRLQSL